jgi:hypothetical protein
MTTVVAFKAEGKMSLLLRTMLLKLFTTVIYGFLYPRVEHLKCASLG